MYNSFARVYTETLDFPITDACFMEDGSFAVVTRSSDYRSVVRVYNKRFEKAAELRSDSYVFDIAANRSKNTLTLVSYDAGNGVGRTTLSVRELSTMEEIEQITLEGEFPLGCEFLDGRCFALVTDRYIRIYDSDFSEKEKSADYSGEILRGFTLSSQGAAVATIEASQNKVYAFDYRGNELFSDSVAYNVLDIGMAGSYLFLQTEQGVARVHASDGAAQLLPSGHGDLLVYNEETAVVCGESKAEYLIFS